jgi:DNA processing protein
MGETLPLGGAISLREEMVAYETLWGLRDQTTKRLSDLFAEHSGTVPTRLLDAIGRKDLFPQHEPLRREVRQFLATLEGFTVAVNGAFQYPQRLQDARYPVRVFYYRGDIGLAESVSVSIVGTRRPTELGVGRAKQIATELVHAGYVIVSGLATGIDTAAMTSTIDAGGRTIGVIGTPITLSYPKENASLQERVATEHLLISHVPFFRYEREPFNLRRRYFPERNALMAALSSATIIVEASETSGTLTQARAALEQGRKLMILNSCFENKDITWPHVYESRGAIRIRDVADVIDHLPPASARACASE